MIIHPLLIIWRSVIGSLGTSVGSPLRRWCLSSCRSCDNISNSLEPIATTSHVHLVGSAQSGHREKLETYGTPLLQVGVTKLLGCPRNLGSMGYFHLFTHGINILSYTLYLLTIDPNFQRVILVLAGAWKGAKELFLQGSPKLTWLVGKSPISMGKSIFKYSWWKKSCNTQHVIRPCI